MIFVRASLLISEKVGYGWRNQKVTLRKEKAKGSQATDRALDEVPPFKDRIIGDLEKRGLGNAPIPERFAERANYLRPLLRNHFCQKELKLCDICIAAVF